MEARDSGHSTDGSQQEETEEEVITVSVSQEVKRFQQEINKVAIENTKFRSWKKGRVGGMPLREALRRSASMDCGLESSSEESEAPCLPPRGRFTSEDSLAEPPRLPPRTKAAKRVSYAPQEATVLGEQRAEEGRHNSTLERRQRQIQPSTHMPPEEPPGGEEVDVEGEVVVEVQEREEPILPSVRQLASRFQVRGWMDARMGG